MQISAVSYGVPPHRFAFWPKSEHRRWRGCANIEGEGGGLGRWAMSTQTKYRGWGMRRPELPDWRNYLTANERIDYETLQINAAEIDKKRQRITKAMRVLQLRCTRRRSTRVGRTDKALAARTEQMG